MQFHYEYIIWSRNLFVNFFLGGENENYWMILFDDIAVKKMLTNIKKFF